MIERNLEPHLLESASEYPVVTVTGPRQSGKTTLCQQVFPEKDYVSLEPLDVQERVRSDPRGFLAEHPAGAIIDEVQHVPSLLGYIQVEVDSDPEPGRFILTGSQHFGLTDSVAQSLAGRTAILELLPLGLDEVRRFPDAPEDLLETLWRGGYPRIHDRHIPANHWLADYITTYVQRDVRQELNVGNLQAFTTFLKLCAGRTAQVLNLSALGGDCGINHNTARAWLSVLESSYIAYRLPAWHRNVKKQLIKSPKLHFFDSGLVCRLLGIEEPSQLRHHPLRGPIFESWVATEIYKLRKHRRLEPNLYYFRDRKGLEVDLVLERGDQLVLAETKSGATVATDFFKPALRLTSLAEKAGEWRDIERRLVYGGGESQRRLNVTVISWSDVAGDDW